MPRLIAKKVPLDQARAALIGSWYEDPVRLFLACWVALSGRDTKLHLLAPHPVVVTDRASDAMPAMNDLKTLCEFRVPWHADVWETRALPPQGHPDMCRLCRYEAAVLSGAGVALSHGVW